MWLLSICINNNSFQYTASCYTKESTGFSLTGKVSAVLARVNRFYFCNLFCTHPYPVGFWSTIDGCAGIHYGLSLTIIAFPADRKGSKEFSEPPWWWWEFQKNRIGQELIARTQTELGPHWNFPPIHPAAVEQYPHIGTKNHLPA